MILTYNCCYCRRLTGGQLHQLANPGDQVIGLFLDNGLRVGIDASQLLGKVLIVGVQAPAPAGMILRAKCYDDEPNLARVRGL